MTKISQDSLEASGVTYIKILTCTVPPQIRLPGRELRPVQRRHALARGRADVRVGGAGARPGRAPAGRAHQATAAAAPVPR